MMKKLKLYLHRFLAGLYFVLAILTILPAASSKPCLLGYRALCSFSPISTTILLAAVCLHFLLQRHAAAQIQAS